MLKEILKDVNKWKDSLCLGVKRLNIVKMTSTDSIKSLSKFQLPIFFFFAGINKPIIKFTWAAKGPRTVKITIFKAELSWWTHTTSF